MDYLDELRARLIIPESYADAYSYFEDLHLLFNMIVNGNGGGNYDNQINELNTRMTTLENRVTIQGLRINNVRTELINLTNDVADLGNSLVSMNQQIGVLNNSKQDKLTPGNGIEINGNVISATGGGGNSVSNIAWLPNVNENGWVSWQRSMSENAPDPVNITGPAGQNGANGNDGFSPTVSMTPIDNGTRVTIVDRDGGHTYNVYNGRDGVNGVNGQNGSDGFSPTVSMSPIDNGTRVTIVDRDGGHTYNVYNGRDGVNGVNGQNGNDGFSPIVSVTPIENGYMVNITDDNGVNSFNVYNGERGPRGYQGVPGDPGQPGASPYIEMTPVVDGYEMNIYQANGAFNWYLISNGANGNNGFSPVVSVTPITNGHQVNITDANGTQSFNVMDGNRGPRGYQGDQGIQGDPGQPGNSPTIEISDYGYGYQLDIYQANGYLNSIFVANGAQGAPGKDGSSFAFSWYQMPGNTVGTYNFKSNNAFCNVAAYKNGLFTVLTTDNTACNLLSDLKCIDIEATWQIQDLTSSTELKNTHTTLYINNFYGNQNLWAPTLSGFGLKKIDGTVHTLYYRTTQFNILLNLFNRTADRIDFTMMAPYTIVCGTFNGSVSPTYQNASASLKHVDIKLF